ncbi:MAG TPA: hypothetical protein VNT32_02375 [Thermoleophilaceae bacterium]|nr:hypothetical protein [Thermoleophilaceae bacterium]
MTAAERESARDVLSLVEWESDEMEGTGLGALWAEWRDELRTIIDTQPEAVA